MLCRGAADRIPDIYHPASTQWVPGAPSRTLKEQGLPLTMASCTKKEMLFVKKSFKIELQLPGTVGHFLERNDGCQENILSSPTLLELKGEPAGREALALFVVLVLNTSFHL